MKFRLGFVSNSSAASFCLFGWWVSKLSEEQVEALWASKHKGLFSIYHPDGELIGVGNSYSEIDHDANEWEDWHDFVSPTPDKDVQQKLLELAQELQLPDPQMYSDTYWD
jgi:hypothetical protein